MPVPKVLVVYYSWWGTTRKIAKALAEVLSCDIEEIVEPRGRAGFLGYLRSVIEARQKRPSVVMPAKTDVSSYDLVVVGTPVWAWSVSSPVRAYLMANKDRFPAIAFFCTLGARGSENAFAQMQSVAGKSPRAVLAVTTRAVASGSYRESLMAFVKAIVPSSNIQDSLPTRRPKTLENAEKSSTRKCITIVQGHPDPSGRHFGNALADAYGDGARAAGHEVKSIEVAKLDFPLLHNAEEFYLGRTPEAIRTAQDAIGRANHLLIVYPLWHGHFPALFHAFLEQTFRPGFAVQGSHGRMPNKLLTGKTARIVITMGMPALFYRWYYRAHSLKSLERNILQFSGIGPISVTLVGGLGAGAVAGQTLESFERDYPILKGASSRERWLIKMRSLGHDGR